MCLSFVPQRAGPCKIADKIQETIGTQTMDNYRPSQINKNQKQFV